MPGGPPGGRPPEVSKSLQGFYLIATRIPPDPAWGTGGLGDWWIARFVYMFVFFRHEELLVARGNGEELLVARGEGEFLMRNYWFLGGAVGADEESAEATGLRACRCPNRSTVTPASVTVL